MGVEIPSTDLNITFQSDYSLAKKGFFAKYTVEYVAECYEEESQGPPTTEYDYTSTDYEDGRHPSSARLAKRPTVQEEDLGALNLQQGRNPDEDDNRAAAQDQEMSTGIKALIGALSAVGVLIGVATLMQVYQYNRIKVITTTQGEQGMGDAPPNLDSERGGITSSKHAMSIDGFTREDVEMIAEHVISAISIRNKSRSSIMSSPNKTLNENYQVTTEYLDPKADKFKKLGKKNAIHDIHDMEEITPVQSPLCRKEAIHDIHEERQHSPRRLMRKTHYHDIHSEAQLNCEKDQRLKPLHSSPC